MLEQVSLAPDYLLHPVQEKWVLENVPTHVYVEMRLFPANFPHLEQRQKVALMGQVIQGEWMEELEYRPFLEQVRGVKREIWQELDVVAIEQELQPCERLSRYTIVRVRGKC